MAGEKLKKLVLLGLFGLFAIIVSLNVTTKAAEKLTYCPTFDEIQAKNSYFQLVRIKYGLNSGLGPSLEESSFYKSVVNACLGYFEEASDDVDCSKLKTLSAAYAYRNFKNSTMKNNIKKTIEKYSNQCSTDAEAAKMLLPRFR